MRGWEGESMRKGESMGERVRVWERVGKGESM